MKVTKWTRWSEELDKKYIGVDDIDMPTFQEIEETIINEIRNKGYKFDGKYHQYGEFGCPIIDDMYIYCVSMRKWGSIMQEAYNLPNGDGLGYCYWAWCPPKDEEPVYPQ